MSAHSLLPHVTALLQQLIALSPGPISVWLIGSRANGRAKPDSDTDLLVFGSPAFLAAARAHLSRSVNVDVLVVTDGDKFEDVWETKSGSLSSWHWKQKSAETATYNGTKFIPDPPDEAIPGTNMGTCIDRIEQAICIWPKD